MAREYIKQPKMNIFKTTPPTLKYFEIPFLLT